MNYLNTVITYLVLNVASMIYLMVISSCEHICVSFISALYTLLYNCHLSIYELLFQYDIGIIIFVGLLA